MIKVPYDLVSNRRKMISKVRGLVPRMKVRIRRKSTVAATTIAKPPHFAVQHILALIQIFVIMDSKCNEIIAISALNVALDAVLTANVLTRFCVTKSARPILIAHLLEDAVAMVIVPKRSFVKEIKHRVIIAINRVNV